MKKKGQITFFVILGLVILTVILIIVYFSSAALRTGEPLKEVIIEEDVSMVKGYVVSCLEDSLKDAVSYCSGNLADGGPKCSDYELDIAARVKEGFCDCVPDCTDFSSIENIIVEVKGEMSVTAQLTNDKKKVTVRMEYPLLIKKGGSEHLIGKTESPFFAEYALEQSDCVIIDVDEDCIAAETKTVEVLGLILTYRENIDKVAIGGTCIAC